MKYIQRFFVIIALYALTSNLNIVLAATNFYIESSDNVGVVGAVKEMLLFISTHSDSINTVQTVINFDSDYLSINTGGLNIYGSACDFWAPTNGDIGEGVQSSPYVYDENKVALACGFGAPSFLQTDDTGHLFLKFNITPIKAGTTSISVSDTSVWTGPGIVASASASQDYDLVIYQTTVSATTTPTPTPDITVFTDSDLTFVEMSELQGTTTTTSTNPTSSTLEIVETDDSIPAPPNLEPRPAATPFIFKLNNSDGSDQNTDGQTSGEVLAVQSLRELLVPGKSQADKTIVLVNLLSLLTFIVILVIFIWRLVMVQKSNKLKTRHLEDLISSEMSMIQSKLSAAQTEDGKAKLQKELDEAVNRIKKDQQK